MNILTGEQKIQIIARAELAIQNDQNLSWRDALISQTESAVLSKLADLSGVEPVAYYDAENKQYLGFAPHWMDYMGGVHEATPLYAESQLNAAQQRTAETCAELCGTRAQSHPFNHAVRRDEAQACEAEILSGAWGKYL